MTVFAFRSEELKEKFRDMMSKGMVNEDDMAWLHKAIARLDIFAFRPDQIEYVDKSPVQGGIIPAVIVTIEDFENGPAA